MAPRITTLCSNRGGCGKSSLASQLAPALALAHPERTVLLLDLSIQGDATTFLLGGVSEPNDAASGARTRGGEALAALPHNSSAADLLDTILKANMNTAPAAPSQRTSFWRGTPVAPPPPAAPAVLDWTAHAVKPCDVHPGGACPPNLWLIPGGAALYGAPFEGVAPALRAALTARDALVLIDTDAELSERGASLAGIAVADELALVLTSSWCDYLRTLDDPANSLIAALRYLAQHVPELTPRIGRVIFNNVQKRLAVPGGFAAAPDVLPFTPPSTTLEALGDIAAHLSSVASMPGHASFFAHQGPAAATSADFLRAYVTAVPTVAESAWQASMLSGIPIVCTPKPTDVQAQAAAHLRGALGGLAPP
jgi:MinD-like ATPase involved in chromosome partitioning or flagellar assembly